MTRATRTLALVLTIAAASAILSYRPVYEPDLGWHLAHGRENLAGRLVRTNLFSFTWAEYPQRYTSWLSETIAYAAWSAGGDAAVRTLQAAALAVTFGFVYLACRVRGAVLPSVAILVFGFLVIEPRAIPRPHLVSFAGVAVCSWLIERARAAGSARPLIAAVPLVAVWSNLHAESMFGPLTIGLFAAAQLVHPSSLSRRESMRALAVAMGCAVALLANPYGWGLIRYLFENAFVPQLLAIAELQPASLPFYRAFFVYVVLAALLLVSMPRRLTAWEGLAALVFAALGYRYLRFTPLVFLVTAPMLAARLTEWSARGLDSRAVLVTALVGALFASRLPPSAYVTSLRAGSLFPETLLPPRAIDFARAEGLAGPVFNSNNLGGWMTWTMYPGVRVFQDSRLQAYPPEHFRTILDASRSQEAWDAMVRGVDWAMLSTPRVNALSGVGRFPTTDWPLIYWDDAVEIVVRRSGRYAPLGSRLEYTLLMPDADIFSLAPILSSSGANRLRAEAQRQRVENPGGFTGAAVTCLSGDRAACEDAERIAARIPSLEREAAFVRALRSGT